MEIELLGTLTLNTAAKLPVFHCKFENQVVLDRSHWYVNLSDENIWLKYFPNNVVLCYF